MFLSTRFCHWSTFSFTDHDSVHHFICCLNPILKISISRQPSEQKTSSCLNLLRRITELIEPANLERIFASPRQRAQKTFELLFGKHKAEIAECSTGGPVLQTTEDVAEWDYGEFEGLKPNEILKIKPGWKIWSDGSVLFI